MSDFSVYALKGDERWAERVYASLLAGEARFGWSYIDDADLRVLEVKIDKLGWDSLSEHEQYCYQHFLLDIRPGDYLVYINLPQWGQCTIARVTSPYFWKRTDEDFNHRLGVASESVQTFDRRAPFVHPALSTRLKLQGRWWRIYATEEFRALLKALQEPKSATANALTPTNLDFLSREIRPLLRQITHQIHHTHPSSSLEGLIAQVLRAVPSVKEVKAQGGAGDQGADILAVVEQVHPLTGEIRQSTCVVQVKSFNGEHWDTGAVDDIRRAFKAYPEADVGMIVSTAAKAGASLESALEKLRSETGKPVTLLIGEDLALFILRFGAHLLSKEPTPEENSD